MKNKLKQNNKGVTLIELLVSIAIFSVVILSATEIFKLVVEGQRNAIAAQNVQENIRYALETMGKEIRMAQLSEGGECDSIVDSPNTLYKVFNLSGDGELYFKNKNGACVSYYLQDGRILITRQSNIAFVTPSEIQVSSLYFDVLDNAIAAANTVQPSVTMAMEIEDSTEKTMHKQQMKLQTTIFSRYYESE